MLKSHKITTIGGCINICQDSNNNIYKIPNYCINDPYFEKEILSVDTGKEDKIINLYIFDLYQNKKDLIKIKITEKCQELKKIYCELNNIKYDENKIRLLFGGVELKDEQYIYQHKIENEYTIQILVKKLSEN
jgi:hypothetical protein